MLGSLQHAIHIARETKSWEIHINNPLDVMVDHQISGEQLMVEIESWISHYILHKWANNRPKLETCDIMRSALQTALLGTSKQNRFSWTSLRKQAICKKHVGGSWDPILRF